MCTAVRYLYFATHLKRSSQTTVLKFSVSGKSYGLQFSRQNFPTWFLKCHFSTMHTHVVDTTTTRINEDVGSAAGTRSFEIYDGSVGAATHGDASRIYKMCCRTIKVCMTCIAAYIYCSHDISTDRDIARRWRCDGFNAAARVKNIQVALPPHYSTDDMHTYKHVHTHTHTHVHTHTHTYPYPPHCLSCISI